MVIPLPTDGGFSFLWLHSKIHFHWHRKELQATGSNIHRAGKQQAYLVLLADFSQLNLQCICQPLIHVKLYYILHIYISLYIYMLMNCLPFAFSHMSGSLSSSRTLLVFAEACQSEHSRLEVSPHGHLVLTHIQKGGSCNSSGTPTFFSPDVALISHCTSRRDPLISISTFPPAYPDLWSASLPFTLN